ncbi:NEDD4 family-interacting protein 1-like [Schistocerca serialis cubense]|uniref:NEDD4 family-interacting protein 1-like n=1 Tax=Schistocerca nitens TaxID=7011 RepID=UPI002118A307|nr:NEDD4 family-interacting protein 1-like [Schistocerca nitens]XP_049837603.1 NEDD4 family-interacting protein 1-like [Schistocerca gregaria]XP_049938256.1 NEDD4 family-interacting protein 1-like [Schistocerca serialis cubense]
MEVNNTYGTASAPSDAQHPTVPINLSTSLPTSNILHDDTTLNAASAPLYNDDMTDDIPPPKADFSAPPPYDAGAKLPTYEEVQREKSLQGESSRVPLAFLAIDTEAADNENGSGLLGTDFMFFTSFLVAFLFNWIGFLLLMCFCHTIAARYGALSGFGLSLAKWTLIVKHSTDLASRENSWLWWIIMTFGLLICVRAIIQYLKIKRGWRLLSGSAQERLLFFY